MVYQEGLCEAASDTLAIGRQRQPKKIPGQEMATSRLACIVVAFLVIGPLEMFAKGMDCQYSIKTVTGSAGIDNVEVKIKLYGDQEICGWELLGNTFNQQSTDYFTISCPCLGCIKKLEIRKQARPNTAWFLVSIGVNALPGPVYYHTVNVNSLLSDWFTNQRMYKWPKTDYRVRVFTGNGGADEHARISLITEGKWSVMTQLNGPFPQNTGKQYYKKMSNMCSMDGIAIRAPNSAWRLKDVYVYNRALQINYHCPCNDCVVNTLKVLTCFEV